MGVLGLTTYTRRQLEKILRHPASASQLRRAQAILWVDDGEPVSGVAQRLRTSRQNIYHWIDRLQRHDGSVAQRLADSPRSGRPATQAEVLDRVIPELLKTDPREQGYPATGWTNRLLRDYLQRHYHLKVGHQSIREAIRRARYRWKRPRYVLARRSPTWRQAKGGLQRGLKGRTRTVVLMADATLVTETPPLRAAYAPIGQQALVPITGNRATRVIFGALNLRTGHLELWITSVWEALTWQMCLRHLRGVWRGWHIVLFIDRGSPHTAEESQPMAADVGIEIRWLPVATPELNALEGLWREGKGHVLANRPTRAIDKSALALCQYLVELTPRQRLQKAGVLSGHFWLTL